MSEDVFFYKEHPRIKNLYVFTCNGDTAPYSDDAKRYGKKPTSRFAVNLCGVEYAIVCPKNKKEIDLYGEGVTQVIYQDIFFDDDIEVDGTIVKDKTFYSSRNDVNVMCRLLNALGFSAFAGRQDRTYKYDISKICVSVFEYGYGNALQVLVNTVEFVKQEGFYALPEEVANRLFGPPLEIKCCNKKNYWYVVYSNAGNLYVKLYHNGCFVTYSARDYLNSIVEKGILMYNPVLSEIARLMIGKIKGKKNCKGLCRRLENIFIHNEDRYSSERKSIELAILLSACLQHCETI